MREWHNVMVLLKNFFFDGFERGLNRLPAKLANHLFLVNKVVLEDIWDVELAIAVVLGDFVLRRLRFLICH